MSGLYSIPLSLPFIDVLAAGLLKRAGGNTLLLPRTTILLPTARACRALREAFLRQSDGPLLLPRMQPLGDLDADELTLRGADIAASISPLRRQALLARALLRSGYSETPAQAASVALALGRFLDELQTEEIPQEAIRGIVPELYASHWQKILDFLAIVQTTWPALLAIEGQIDAAERRRLIYEALTAEWTKSPPTEPVILAGSNGSVKALRRLMKTVMELDNGEVILHGLDRHMDEPSWQAMDCSHPQHLFRTVLDQLGTDRATVADWPEIASTAAEGREWLVSTAMAPSETSGAWHGLTAKSFPASALDDLLRLDCANLREEAESIALLFRQTLETPGKRAALVTPDRELARLVAASLERWNIAVDDSAGIPLSTTPPAGFLRLIAVMAEEDLAPYPLLACLKHPLAQGGLRPGEFRRRVRLLERCILRGPAPAMGFAGLIASLETPEVKQEDRDVLLPWLRGLQELAAPFLHSLEEKRHPPELLRAHVALAEALATTEGGVRGAELWKGNAGNCLAEFVSEALEALQEFPSITEGYPAFLDAILSGRIVRGSIGLHPRLFIWGTIEARLQQTDLMILGGLNEDTWPEPSPADPFLSRPMRADLGLPPPEFRVGISAHDFASGLAAPHVVLTRSQRVKGVPTVPSRWLLRLDAVLQASGSSLARAADTLEIMRLLDQAKAIIPESRPHPTPPVSARPRRFTVSDVEAWLNDPYRFYAKRVLRLAPLDEIAAEPGAAERGTLIHEILELFADRYKDQKYPNGLPETALADLLGIGRSVFDRSALAPAVEAFWWPRFERVAGWIVETEQARRSAGIFPVALEISARHQLKTDSVPFTLIAKADRIDRHPDGSFEIIDYKTGGTPSEKDVRSGTSPQLPLEAALVEAGAFPNLPAAEVHGVAYWKLSGGATLGEIKPFTELPQDMLERLAARVALFDDPETPYLAIPPTGSLVRLGYHAEYEHLERVAEWSGGGEDEE